MGVCCFACPWSDTPSSLGCVTPFLNLTLAQAVLCQLSDGCSESESEGGGTEIYWGGGNGRVHACVPI